MVPNMIAVARDACQEPHLQAVVRRASGFGRSLRELSTGKAGSVRRASACCGGGSAAADLGAGAPRVVHVEPTIRVAVVLCV